MTRKSSRSRGYHGLVIAATLASLSPVRAGADEAIAATPQPTAAVVSTSVQSITPASALPPRRSEALRLGGILVSASGTITLLSGVAFLGAATDRTPIYCETGSAMALCGQRDDTRRQGAGIALILAGGLGLAAGIPLAIYGSRRVVDGPKSATIEFGPASARLSVAF